MFKVMNRRGVFKTIHECPFLMNVYLKAHRVRPDQTSTSIELHTNLAQCARPEDGASKLRPFDA